MKISGAILAAGKSLRMGRNKLLLHYNDQTVIECNFITVWIKFDRLPLPEIVACGPQDAEHGSGKQNSDEYAVENSHFV